MCVWSSRQKWPVHYLYLSTWNFVISRKNVQADPLPAQQCAVGDHKPGYATALYREGEIVNY